MFKFIDLFAGIGGFHIAMEKLGGVCVFASEIDHLAISTYFDNFGIDSNHDITKTDAGAIPEFDVLCAGFPCQAFSKAGNQKGFSDTRGTLFFDIERILSYHLEKFNKPKMIVLENVRNLISHDDGNTWLTIKNRLTNLGYIITEEPIIVSPHYIDIPQLRERVLIIGLHKTVFNDSNLIINIPKKKRNGTNAKSVLIDDIENEKYKITNYETKILDVWDEFILGVSPKTIGFPIWIDYMFIENSDEIKSFPDWKQKFINQNKDFYIRNKDFIDNWYNKHEQLSWAKPTDRKFEWQAGETINSLWEGIIQFRPSGIRVKQPTEFPALVAMVHIPIIGWEKRRLSPREVAKLQSFPSEFKINSNSKAAYKQFGNAVNAEVIYHTVKNVLDKYSIFSQIND